MPQVSDIAMTIESDRKHQGPDRAGVDSLNVPKPAQILLQGKIRVDQTVQKHIAKQEVDAARHRRTPYGDALVHGGHGDEREKTEQ